MKRKNPEPEKPKWEFRYSIKMKGTAKEDFRQFGFDTEAEAKAAGKQLKDKLWDAMTDRIPLCISDNMAVQGENIDTFLVGDPRRTLPMQFYRGMPLPCI